MADHKEALSSLSPISWKDFPSDDELSTYLRRVFSHAEQIINSIPIVSASDPTSDFVPAPANSARKALDTLCDPSKIPLPPYQRDAEAVKGHGTPYKLSEKDNPLGVQVYKSAAHDRRGAWFSRRSVHQGLGFERWKRCAQLEFLESLKVQEGPGIGAVRGISADRRVERKVVEGLGTVEVWQTSSVFGPVTPRESLTIVISSTDALSALPSGGKPPRHLLFISRPTEHDDVPNRPKLVKMEYESAEMIREIPLPNNQDPEANPIEWLMITRSDPGGGIPKFMVERGTPSSIAGDVVKFLNWATSKSENDLEREDEDTQVEQLNGVADQDDSSHNMADGAATEPFPAVEAHPQGKAPSDDHQQEQGFYSKLSGAASAYLPASLASQASNADGAASRSNPSLDARSSTRSRSSSTSSDTSDSSHASFRSATSAHHHALSGPSNNVKADPPKGGADGATPSASSTSLSAQQQQQSSSTDGTPRSLSPAVKHSHHTSNKELQKLLHKRHQLTEKHQRDRAASNAKTAEVAAQAEAARGREEKASSSNTAKDSKEGRELKEKEKMLARQERDAKKREERYQNELKKIDEKRIKEEKKDAERVKKKEAKDEAGSSKQEIQSLKNELAQAQKEGAEWRIRAEKAEAEVKVVRAESKSATGNGTEQKS